MITMILWLPISNMGNCLTKSKKREVEKKEERSKVCIYYNYYHSEDWLQLVRVDTSNVCIIYYPFHIYLRIFRCMSFIFRPLLFYLLQLQLLLLFQITNSLWPYWTCRSGSNYPLPVAKHDNLHFFSSRHSPWLHMFQASSYHGRSTWFNCHTQLRVGLELKAHKIRVILSFFCLIGVPLTDSQLFEVLNLRIG